MRILIICLLAFNLNAQQTRIVGVISNNYITSFDSSYVVVERCNYGNLGYITDEFLEVDVIKDFLENTPQLELEKFDVFYMFNQDMSVGVLVNMRRDRICSTTIHYDGILLSKRYYPRY